MRLLYLFSSLVILLSCRKPSDPVDPCFCAGCCDSLNTQNPIKLLWSQPLGPDTLDYASMPPVVFQDKVLFSLAFYVDNQDFLKMRSVDDGRLVWQWEPYLEPGQLGLGPHNNAVKGDIYVANTWSELYGINLNDGSNLWSAQIDQNVATGMPRIMGIGDYVYHPRANQVPASKYSCLARAPFSTGVFDTLFHFEIENGYSPNIEMPALWVDPAGDSILVFQNRQWNFPASKGKIDFYAFNLKTRQIVWKIDNIDPDGNSSIAVPLVYQNKIYFKGLKTCFCIDAKTGQVSWKKRFQEYDHLLVSNLLIAEGKLFVKPANEAVLYALDPLSGNVLYSVPNAGASECQMVYYKGNIYYGSDGSGYIYSIRASDGNLNWKFKSPNAYKKTGAAFKQIAIDENTGKLFVTDSYYAMCFQL